MTKRISYTSFLCFLFALLLVNCKTDNNTSTSSEKESKEDVIAGVEKGYSKNLDTLDGAKEINMPDPSEVEITEELPANEVKNESLSASNKTQKPTSEKPEISTKNTKSSKTISRKKPKIQFEELTWNFGVITEGDIVERKFKFTNTGNAPLEILATSATCGCTRPTFPFLDIAPGESNVIGVSYNSVGKDGNQTAEVTIESNTFPKTTIIKLNGKVKPKPKKDGKSDDIESEKDTIALKQN